MSLRAVACMLTALLLATAASSARAGSDALGDLLPDRGGAGVGIATRVESSLYRGAGTRYDLLPLYLYEGKYAYLHAYRAGLKLLDTPHRSLRVFLSHRFEGFPADHIPPSLVGMAPRNPEIDAGVGYERRGSWGAIWGEVLHDVTNASDGSELRLGYDYSWRDGRLMLRPQFMLSWRNSLLNDYYYGVRPDEATPQRPAYEPGAGLNTRVGLYGTYDLSLGWRLLAGVSLTRWSQGVRASPIVNNRTQVSSLLGVMYDFSPSTKAWPEHRPLILKLMYGKATNCNLINIMTLGCASTTTTGHTRISGIAIGRPFVRHLNGWPIDFVGFVGLLRHEESGLQPNSWQVDAYIQGYWYGFPWSDRVRTRLGFGVGMSYAGRVPYVEARSQAERGRNTSKLLNYLNPTIDFSVGDLLGKRAWRDTYFGFGVSHRSGIFGTSQLFGNVNGGSNYIYSYIETPLN